MTPLFFVTNIWLGAGLAMDACAVSMSDGLNEPKMTVRKMLLIAATFGLFQALMPIIGYFAGHALIDYIGAYIPWIALALLTVLGGKMIFDGVRERIKEKNPRAETPAAGSTETAAETTAAAEGITAAAEQAAGADKPTGKKGLTVKTLMIQAVATSIDALSVGLTIADYSVVQALIAAVIIAAVTFGICVAALFIGKKFGDKGGSVAEIVGGAILIAVGIEICLTGVL